MSQTFEEYTRQRISDYQKLQTALPEILPPNFEPLLKSMLVKEHLESAKEKLDQYFERSITWLEFDVYSNSIGKFCHQKICLTGKIYDSRILQDVIQLQVDIRKEFCKLIGCIEPDWNNYIEVVKANIIMHNGKIDNVIQQGE